MLPIPLQVVDSFFLQVNLGDVLIVGFVLGLLALLPKRSGKLLTLHLLAFGALFLVSPGSLYAPAELSIFNSIMPYKLLGVALLVVSPVLYVSAEK